jgi:hypothetical protein
MANLLNVKFKAETGRGLSEEGRSNKCQFYSLWAGNPRSTALEASMLNITPLMRYRYNNDNDLIIRWLDIILHASLMSNFLVLYNADIINISLM